MKLFEKVFKVYTYRLIFWAVFIVIICTLLWFYKASDPKLVTLLGSIAAGLIVGWLQLLLMATEHREMQKIKKLGIKEILPYRDDEIFYRNLINKARKEVIVLGSTANRFMRDFADENREDKKALIDALNRGVSVKLLLPDPNHLWNSKDVSRAQDSFERIQRLRDKYPDRIECKYFSHNPFHNLVLIDNECLVGPIFPKRTSQNTPTIYTDKDSIFATSYYEYFKDEWAEAISCLSTQ